MQSNNNKNQFQFNPEEGVDALEKYGIDLTKLAEEGKIDPVIGRVDEIRRIIQILSRRTKNNPVLIGEPGTGKTTVVEGLARKIIEGDVPENLKKKRLIAMDLAAMLAGAMFRGQFEERLKNFIKQVKKADGEIIVFIDELHTIVGAGAMEGQMDVSNMIKPELARGTFKVVGATTLKEYQKYIEKDAALERRFQQVYIDEPSVEETITILRGIKDKYEVHHGIRIQDSALIAAATLSERYISDRFLPDKAVDLVDEAASKIRMEINSAPEPIDNLNRKLMQFEIEKESLKKEKDERSRKRLIEVKEKIRKMKVELDLLNQKWQAEKDILNQINQLKEQIEKLNTEREKAQREGNYQKAAKIQYNDLPNLEKEIESKNNSLDGNSLLRLEVREEDIAEVVAKWTGIPVSKVMAGEHEKLLHLEDALRKRVVGQDEVLKLVSDSIRMSKMGVVDRDRPIGSFLFMGNTGVGKTETAKALAEYLFDDEKALVRLDMSEYMEQHSVAKIIGSPPGYIGYDEGGQLTEKIRRRPYAVILFDEIEKAHPNVLNILLQLLDDGRLTDTKGRTVNFKNTVVIMTSNLKENELRNYLRPEFINRIDEIITFNDLDRDAIGKIVDIQLSQVVKLLNEQNIKITISDKVRDYVAKNGYNPQFGARPIRRLIRREILSNLSKYLLGNPDVENVSVDLADEQISFSS